MTMIRPAATDLLWLRWRHAPWRHARFRPRIRFCTNPDVPPFVHSWLSMSRSRNTTINRTVNRLSEIRIRPTTTSGFALLGSGVGANAAFFRILQSSLSWVERRLLRAGWNRALSKRYTASFKWSDQNSLQWTNVSRTGFTIGYDIFKKRYYSTTKLQLSILRQY